MSGISFSFCVSSLSFALLINVSQHDWESASWVALAAAWFAMYARAARQLDRLLTAVDRYRSYRSP